MTGFIRFAAIALLALLLPGPVAAGTIIGTHYYEDFSTTLHRDSIQTIAEWDTIAGEVRLAPFKLKLEKTVPVGSARDVTIRGNYAYVANYGDAGPDPDGLWVFDIRSPLNPLLVATEETPTNARGVAVSGNFAYIAGQSTLDAFDISNPAAPVWLSTMPVGQTYGHEIDGDNLIAIDNSYLRLHDITDPAAPAITAFLSLPYPAQEVALSGNYAAAAIRTSGVQIVDISDTANPVALGLFDTAGEARGVAIDGDLVYVADGPGGLQILDFSNPALPVFVGGAAVPGNAWAVKVEGDLAYVTEIANGGLWLFDVQNPAAPVLIDSLDVAGLPFGMALHGKYAFLASHTGGLQTVLIKHMPSTPIAHGSVATPGSSLGLDVQGDVAYVADGVEGIRTIDISDPASPDTLGSYALIAYGVDATGDVAVVAAENQVAVLDISDPTNLTLLGSVLEFGDVFIDVEVAGDHAYVVGNAGSGNGRFVVVDISDPATPLEAAFPITLFGGVGYAIEVRGDHAYIAAEASGILVYDITDPTLPTFVAQEPPYLAGAAYDLVVEGNRAYVAQGSGGLVVLNIDDPAAPGVTDVYPTTGSAFGIDVVGDFAWVCEYGAGVSTWYVRTVLQGAAGIQANMPNASRIRVAGDHAFVTDGNGLQVVRVAGRFYDLESNWAVSTPLSRPGYTATWYHADAAWTGTSLALVSADGGLDWHVSGPPYGQWWEFPAPGDQVMWKVGIVADEVEVSPTLSELWLDWLHDAAIIQAIADVPADQGGWVRLSVSRSGKDFSGQVPPASLYDVYRRIDSPAMASSVRGRAVATKSAPGLRPTLVAGETRYVDAIAAAPGTFPPGMWEHVTSLGTLQQDEYVVLAPTPADSSAGAETTTYVVVTHTTDPSTWFVSWPESGYSVDNLPPPPPQNVAAAYNTGAGNALSWEVPDANDVAGYRVYRSLDPNFIPSPADLLQETQLTSWTDPVADGWMYHYKITALDGRNESDPAGPDVASSVRDAPDPGRFALFQNAPNPFNPMTTIRYDVPPGGGATTLRIYDVRGALVRTLVDGVVPPGSHSVAWNGRNQAGRSVPSGVYFYRLEAPGYTKTLKMVMVE